MCEEKPHDLPLEDTGRSSRGLQLQGVVLNGSRGVEESGLGLRVASVVQKASSVQVGVGPVVDGCEWPGLGTDPFNLMPTIEQHQRVRRRKYRRGKTEGGALLGTAQYAAGSQTGNLMPGLGKRLVREDEDLTARTGGRRRLMESSDMISSLAEVDMVPPRRQQ